MKVAFLQTSPLFGKVRENVEKAVRRLNSIDAELVVLPELFSTGYQFRSKKEALGLSEDVTAGYATSRLIEAAKAGKMHIVAGIAERAGGRVYNSSVLVGPRGVVGVYRKAHLFWNEKKIFARGDTPLKVYNIGKARVGMMICFDWIFPEVARTLALKGADIICQPSNLVLPFCPQAMITRSIENRVFSITANRVGVERRVKGRALEFIGSSQIVSPAGTVIRRAGGRREEAGAADIEPRDARDKHITPLNHIMKDRRVDIFEL
ncbi:MAG: acyltransferase [Deltaproteobacteria bacterium]|nr:acyltransferase [Deltaproteobacteria bacterium]